MMPPIKDAPSKRWPLDEPPPGGPAVVLSVVELDEGMVVLPPLGASVVEFVTGAKVVVFEDGAAVVVAVVLELGATVVFPEGSVLLLLGAGVVVFVEAGSAVVVVFGATVVVSLSVPLLADTDAAGVEAVEADSTLVFNEKERKATARTENNNTFSIMMMLDELLDVFPLCLSLLFQ